MSGRLGGVGGTGGGVREGLAGKFDECFTLFAIFAKKGRKLRWNPMENARKWYHFAPSIVRFSVGEVVQGRLLEDTSPAILMQSPAKSESKELIACLKALAKRAPQIEVP